MLQFTYCVILRLQFIYCYFTDRNKLAEKIAFLWKDLLPHLHLDVHYVRSIRFVQRFKPQRRRFTNFHYYY